MQGRLSFERIVDEELRMKILVLGGGGREHALVWKLKRSPRVEKIWCAPGNGGIAAEAECVAIDAGDVGAAVALAENIQPDLTIVGPELPLVNGLTDAFRRRNWAIVGPSQQAAQLEGSKIFSKQFLERHRIPTAKIYGMYDSPADVYRALGSVAWPVVIKADGLCAGKGVLLAPDFAPAEGESSSRRRWKAQSFRSSFSLTESGMRHFHRHAITSAYSMGIRDRTQVAWGHTPPMNCCRMIFERSSVRRLSSQRCMDWPRTASAIKGFCTSA